VNISHIGLLLSPDAPDWMVMLHHKPHRPAFFLSFSPAHRNTIRSPDTLTNFLLFLPYHFCIQQHSGHNTMPQNTQSINFGGNNAQCGNIINSFNTGGPDGNAEIMRWLSPLEPNIRHQGVRTGRFGSVGGWLFETSEFREWRDGEGGAERAVLFCSGNSGVGKTYLRYLAGFFERRGYG